MAKNRQKLTKTTVMLPESLLKEAQAVTKSGITQTIRSALEILAKKSNFEAMLKLEGSYDSKLDLKQLRED